MENLRRIIRTGMLVGGLGLISLVSGGCETLNTVTRNPAVQGLAVQGASSYIDEAVRGEVKKSQGHEDYWGDGEGDGEKANDESAILYTKNSGEKVFYMGEILDYQEDFLIMEIGGKIRKLKYSQIEKIIN